VSLRWRRDIYIEEIREFHLQHLSHNSKRVMQVVAHQSMPQRPLDRWCIFLVFFEVAAQKLKVRAEAGWNQFTPFVFHFQYIYIYNDIYIYTVVALVHHSCARRTNQEVYLQTLLRQGKKSETNVCKKNWIQANRAKKSLQIAATKMYTKFCRFPT
jgi:hypothetical protein